MTYPISIGDKFGQLTVERVDRGNGIRRKRINCRCSCGRRYSVGSARLWHGEATRCYNCANPKWFPGNESHIRAQYVNYRGGAARRGYDHQLTIDEFREIYQAPCNYCGISPSRGIDRKNNGVGYLIENCVPCCKHCNLAKRDMPEAEFLAWVARIAAFQGFSL